MLKPSKKLLFAIEAVLDIAYHAGGEPVQSAEITRRQGIPRRYLEQALQHLVRAGILVGVRGPRGGYRLARERRRITIGDIVRVVGEDGEWESLLESRLGRDVVAPLWSELQATVMENLDSVTIESLCVRADAAGVPSEGRDTLNFII